MREHDHVVECVAFSTAAVDKAMRAVMRSGAAPGEAAAAGGASGGASAAADVGEGGEAAMIGSGSGAFVVSGSRDRTVRVWMAATGHCVMVLVSAAAARAHERISGADGTAHAAGPRQLGARSHVPSSSAAGAERG